ncbi:hypothetical protein PSN_1908 [Pseudomonas sp. NGC7]
MGKVVTLGFLNAGAAEAVQPGVIKSARYARGSQVKRGALYTPASAQASTRCVISLGKNAAILWCEP